MSAGTSRRRPSLAAGALLAAAGLAGCGSEPPLAAADLRIDVRAPVEEVAPGRAFPLTVVRTWQRDLRPTAFDERSLAPLVLRLEEATLREDGERFEETRRYRAYAMSRSDLTIRPPRIAARPADGGPARVEEADGLTIRVRPEVDARDPGPPEMPSPPERPAPPVGPWIAAVALGATLLALLLARARGRPRGEPVPAPAGPPPVTPEDEALAALERIRGAPGNPGEAVVAAADVVRAWLEKRHAVPALERTTREVLAAPALRLSLTEAARAPLADLLAGADRVKFAAHAPSPEEREVRLQDARSAVLGGKAPP